MLKKHKIYILWKFNIHLYTYINNNSLVSTMTNLPKT